MAISDTPPIATGKCSYTACGAKINFRRTHGGLVYYTCRGEHGLKQCRRHEKMGRQESAEFIAKLKHLEESETNGEKEDTGRVGANDNKEPGKTSEPKRAGGGWGLDF